MIATFRISLHRSTRSTRSTETSSTTWRRRTRHRGEASLGRSDRSTPTISMSWICWRTISTDWSPEMKASLCEFRFIASSPLESNAQFPFHSVDRIDEVSKQTVAGISYKIRGHYVVEGEPKDCTVSILERAWQDEEKVIISAKCDDGSCYVTETYTCSPKSLLTFWNLRAIKTIFHIDWIIIFAFFIFSPRLNCSGFPVCCFRAAKKFVNTTWFTPRSRICRRNQQLPEITWKVFRNHRGESLVSI